jgi:hypothetical protein
MTDSQKTNKDPRTSKASKTPYRFLKTPRKYHFSKPKEKPQMKTFQQWEQEFTSKCMVDDSIADRFHRHRASAWYACDTEWRLFLENEQPAVEYSTWVHSFQGLPTKIDAWSFQDKQWRHIVANKVQALNLKSEAFELLKKKNEELEKRVNELACLYDKAIDDRNKAKSRCLKIESQYKEAMDDLDELTLEVVESVENYQLLYSDKCKAIEIRQRYKLDIGE